MRPISSGSYRVDERNLGVYLREITRYQPLSNKQEFEAAKAIRRGDREAFEMLVRTNLRFVVSVAHNYLHQGMPLPDLINEGNIGLIRAAHRFDEKKNFRFISYAVWWIRQSILQGLANQSRILRVPVNRVATIHQVGRTRASLEQKLQRPPSMQEVADTLGISPEEVAHVHRVGASSTSLDAPFGADNPGTRLEQVRDEQIEGPAEFLDETAEGDQVWRLLRFLSPRERKVIRMYFGIQEETSYTLDEIASQFAITRERVRQIKESAMEKLQRAKDMVASCAA